MPQLISSNTDMEELAGFKLYLLRAGKSQGTIEKHTTNIRGLLSRLSTLNTTALEQHLIALHEKGQSAGHLNNIIEACRAWGKYLKTEEFTTVKYFPVKPGNKATLSDREIEEFLNLEALPTHDKTKHKLYTLFFKILAYSGMRPGEVATLTVEQIDFGRNIFSLERTKTTPRLVPISPALLHDLTEHIRALSTEYLFVNDRGTPITRDNWHHHFNERLKRLGIKRPHLSTHSLRHSFITRLLDEDVNLFKVQNIVGHTRIQTTAAYTHLTTKSITRAIAKDPLMRNTLSKADLALRAKEQLEKDGFTVVEFRELDNGNIRLEIS